MCRRFFIFQLMKVIQKPLFDNIILFLKILPTRCQLVTCSALPKRPWKTDIEVFTAHAHSHRRACVRARQHGMKLTRHQDMAMGESQSGAEQL